MAPEAVTAERIHHSLRHMLRHGELGIGIPLVVQALADGFGVSITPVRDALNRLVGERLVDVHPGGGFAVPGMTKERAVSLYEWHADIVGTILKKCPDPDRLGPVPDAILAVPVDARIVAALTVDLFGRIGSASVNSERRLALERVSDRLHMLRLYEGHLTRQGAELRLLWQVLCSGNASGIRAAVGRYHRRRLTDAGQIVLATMGGINIKRLAPGR